MISELKDAGHVLTDEQQLQAVIRSLSHTWEHMKVNLTHNESIKTLNDAARHLELEEDRIEASKSQETETAVHLAGSSSHGGQGQKRKSNFGRKGKQEKNIRGRIVARERLLIIVIGSIIKSRSSVSIVAKRVTMLVNAKSPASYKLQKNFHIFHMFPVLFL